MGSIGTIITIILVVIWVVRGIAAATGHDEQGKQNKLKREIERERARRLRIESGEVLGEIEVFDEAQIQSMAGGRQQPTRDLSQMTMAQRIELARQRARQDLAGRSANGDAAEALRQAREQAEQQAQREQAERRRAMQEKQRREIARQRAAERQAQAERRARRQTRAQRRATQAKQGNAATQAERHNPSAIQVREQRMREPSRQRVHATQPSATRTQCTGKRKAGRVSVSPLTAASLRKAVVMKELLDKPIALRNPQDDLLS